MSAVEDGFQLVTYEHPNGCLAQGSMVDDEWQPLREVVELAVPIDRSGPTWSGVSCGACGQDLVEVDGA